MARRFLVHRADYGVASLEFEAFSRSQLSTNQYGEDIRILFYIGSNAETISGEPQLICDTDYFLIRRATPPVNIDQEAKIHFLKNLIWMTLPTVPPLVAVSGLLQVLNAEMGMFVTQAIEDAFAAGFHGFNIHFYVNVLRLGLKRGRYSEAGDRFELGECRICLEELNDDKDVALMQCSHVFHYNCLIQWLEGSTCPLCNI